MKAYLDIVRKVLETGELKSTRQGTEAYTIAGEKFEHDMAAGYPLLTTKKVPWRLVASELEFLEVLGLRQLHTSTSDLSENCRSGSWFIEIPITRMFLLIAFLLLN